MNVNEIRNIAVVGAGLMGHGIALEFALAGYPVAMHDLTDGALEKGMARIRENLHMLQRLGRVTAGQTEQAVGRIRTSTEMACAVDAADVAIESVAEDLEQKLAVFSQLDALCPAHTILASNSSSYMPSKLAAATKRPDQVVGTHYFNPPFLIPLVEVVRSERTSEEAAKAVYDLMAGIGKAPVLLHKEVPGFVANRIQAAVWREILSLVADGVASPQDVDRAVTTSIGRRWAVAGPFEVTELVGLDLKQAILSELFPSLASDTQTPAILRDKVARGELGVKTGQGFYRWTEKQASALRERIARALVEIDRWR